MKVAWVVECARLRNTLHTSEVGLEYVEEGCGGKSNMTSIFCSPFHITTKVCFAFSIFSPFFSFPYRVLRAA